MGEMELTLGELKVIYEGARASVRWLVDVNAFYMSGQDMSCKFTLMLWGIEVPFVFMFNHRDASSAEDASQNPHSGSKKSRVEAILQIKCAVEALPEGFSPLQISFGVGGQEPRVASNAHNFKQMPTCELASDKAVWQLAAGGEEPLRCLIRAEMFPASEAKK